MPQFILASSSHTRLKLLRAAGVDVASQPARIDEAALRAGLEAEDAMPQDIADFLAEMKARKIAERQPEALVLGCDQVLEFKGKAWGKPETQEEAKHQLMQLRGQKHQLLSAVVLYHEAKPVWRHVGKVRLTMHSFSEGWLEGYIARNWDHIRHSAGAYLLEEEGIRLFSEVEGDYFTILGLPLFPLLGYLRLRGFIET